MRTSDAAHDDARRGTDSSRRQASHVPVIALLLLALVFAAGCSVPRFEVTPRVGYMQLDGDVALDSGNFTVSGSAKDLDLDDDEVVVQPRIDVDWGSLHLSAQGLWHSLSGDGQADVTATVGGQPVTVNAPVETDFDFGLFSVEAAYDIIPTDFIDVGLGLGVGVIDYDIEISSPVQNAWVRADDTVPFGYLMARVAKDLWRFKFLVNLRGMAIKFQEHDMSYGDLDAMVSFSLFGSESRFDGRLVAGYRYIHLDYEYDNGTDVDVDDLRLTGPFLGLTIAF